METTKLRKMLSSKKDVFNCDQQAKFIQERIILTEKNFSQIYQVFSEYLRKTARVRDKNDEIAKIFMAYSENEEVNKTLANGLANFALSFSILGDLGDLRVQKVETKVLSDLAQYDGICKNAKDEVKHIFTVRDREMVKKRQLDRLRERNPRNRQQISQAETDLLRATAEVTKTIQGLQEQTNDFEKRKLHDIKSVMLNFIAVEMAYHAKSLEVLTKAYQEMYAVDEESDLQDFQDLRGNLEEELHKTLKTSNATQNYKTKLNMFKSTQSLGSLNTLFHSPKKQTKDLKRPSTSINKLKSNENVDEINTMSEDSEDESVNSESDVVDKFLAQKHKIKFQK